MNKIMRSLVIYFCFIGVLFLFFGHKFFMDLLGRLSFGIWAGLAVSLFIGIFLINKRGVTERDGTVPVKITRELLKMNKNIVIFIAVYSISFGILDPVYLFKLVNFFSANNYVAFIVVRLLLYIPPMLAIRMLTKNPMQKTLFSFAAIPLTWIIKTIAWGLMIILQMLVISLVATQLP